MKQGDVPRLDKIVDFARGFDLDVNHWLTLAGYEPIPSSGNAEESGYEVFLRGATALFAARGREAVPIALMEEAAKLITPEQAREALLVLDRQMEEGLF